MVRDTVRKLEELVTLSQLEGLTRVFVHMCTGIDSISRGSYVSAGVKVVYFVDHSNSGVSQV